VLLTGQQVLLLLLLLMLLLMLLKKRRRLLLLHQRRRPACVRGQAALGRCGFVAGDRPALRQRSQRPRSG
jgi:uncharacterized membrane protein YfcA